MVRLPSVLSDRLPVWQRVQPTHCAFVDVFWARSMVKDDAVESRAGFVGGGTRLVSFCVRESGDPSVLSDHLAVCPARMKQLILPGFVDVCLGSLYGDRSCWSR